MSVIDKREEFLFLYDIKDNNPNGDPMDENKPRIDQESNHNFVTDVRLKRTIRDYLFEYKGFDGSKDKDIFVRSKESESNKKGDKKGLQDGKERASDFGNDAKAIIKQCIDIRLFGGVIPLDKDSIRYTGPVQMRMGRSLHRVELKHVKGTGAFASKAGATQRTFREEYVLPYSLIGFYGVVNDVAAKHTELSVDDLDLFYDAMWEGTRNLISRTKVGQSPRLLLRIQYKTPGFFLGDLDRRVSFEHPKKRDEEIRDISDGTVNLSALRNALTENGKHVASVTARKDDRVVIDGWES